MSRDQLRNRRNGRNTAARDDSSLLSPASVEMEHKSASSDSEIVLTASENSFGAKFHKRTYVPMPLRDDASEGPNNGGDQARGLSTSTEQAERDPRVSDVPPHMGNSQALDSEQVAAVNEAVNNLSSEQRAHLEEHAIKIAALQFGNHGYESDDINDLRDIGPSCSKGKGPDVRNWVDLNLSDEEADLKVQRRLFEAWRKAHREAKPRLNKKKAHASAK